MLESLRQKIYQSIREDITFGRLFPGERLIESTLAEEFNASRSPIREAIRQLESEGLVSFAQNKGITVSKLSVKEIEEIYDLRSILESYATRLAIMKIEKDHVAYLSDLQRKLKTAARNSDVLDWINNNVLFHNFFIENSGNANLHQVLDSLKSRVNRYYYMIVKIPGHFKEYLKHHEGILNACEARDGDMGEENMRLHLDTIKRVLVNYINQFPGF